MPDPVHRVLIAEIYRLADQPDRERLTQAERSSWYDRWMEDSAIRGVLRRFIPQERARVWLKTSR